MTIKNLWNRPANDPEFDAAQAARKAFFDKIAPKPWKGPIDCWIDKKDFADCDQAAVYFTGCGLEQIGTSFDKVHVVAPGYWATIGA